MANFGGASRGAVLRLRCPHCRTVQARARAKKGATYACRQCKKTFTREQGEAAAGENR